MAITYFFGGMPPARPQSRFSRSRVILKITITHYVNPSPRKWIDGSPTILNSFN
ncbi:MAG: hypothetical protein N2487_03555 [Verrucomicrobiae bacterium]|nr:hypothetical protein [Verrucomicrobiae bacterium]